MNRQTTAPPDAADSALLTDLYQVAMLQSHFKDGTLGQASFELFTHTLPQGRNFLLAAGLEQVLDWLQRLRFREEELAWLAGTGRFSTAFLEWLGGLRFAGDVWAVPEGTACFATEPLLRITAPLPQAQLVESRVLNLVHYQPMVASKAARCVLAAPDKLLVDFGLRRSHGAEAGMLAARASYLAGFSGTATALAGLRFGIPAFGTMAHAFVQAHGDEMRAFAHFARAQPGHATLLLDTYDTEAAAHKVVTLARHLATEGIAVQGVRLDSGDLADHARRVRSILDAGGLTDVTIFASGDLDESRITGLLAAGAPIDGFGIGTRMTTSADAPYLDLVYKLVDYSGRPCRKRSEGKVSWPGIKQVWRHRDARGMFTGDVVSLEGDPQDGEALLHPVMHQGVRLAPPVPLAQTRAYARMQVAALPPALRSLEAAPPFPVRQAPQLQALARRLAEDGL